jgi:hypothetical protein
MPCNVAVYERAPGDPTQSAQATGNAHLVELAFDVKKKLTSAFDRLEAK